MTPDVGLQVFLLVEGGVTKGALVDFLPEMCNLMQLENMIIAEAFATDLTLVGLLLGVGSQVNLELFAASESFVKIGRAHV